MAPTVPVRVLPASPDPGVFNALQASLIADPRITMPASASTADLLVSLMERISVDAIIVDATFIHDVGEGAFMDFLRSLTGCVALVLVPPDLTRLNRDLQQLSQVRSTYVLPIQDYAALAAEVYERAREERTRRERIAPTAGFFEPGPITAGRPTVGQLILGCYSIKGGTGKTTVATNLARWFQDHVGPTCLMGFDVPDDVGVILGLNSAPNSSTFMTRPTDPDSFAASLQNHNGLDVCLSVNDEVLAEEIKDRSPELYDKLILAARNHVSPRTGSQYAVIVLDLPPTTGEDVVRPLLQCSQVLLIVIPDIACIIKAAASVRLLSQRFAGQHRISTERIHLIVNRMRGDTNLREDGIHQIMREALGDQTPAIRGILPDDPAVCNLQNEALLPVSKRTSFGEALSHLAEGLVGYTNSRRGSVTDRGVWGRVRQLGNLIEIR